MAHRIGNDCIACGACAETCPINAITEGDGIFVVDEAECIDCGACEGACPVEAIREA